MVGMSKVPIIAITGTSWGLGSAILAHAPTEWTIVRINRAGGPGLPDPEFMRNVFWKLTQSGADVFVNNVYGGGSGQTGEDQNPQLSLFRGVLNMWRDDPSKTIINICSMASYFAQTPAGTGVDQVYRQNKLALRNASEQATLDTENVKCRVIAFSPGYVLTARTEGKPYVMLSAAEAARYVWWLIQQPQDIRIPHFAVFAVDKFGNQIKSGD
jgi:hypothetical protein